MKKTLQTVNINDITPYENNPRHNDQAVEAVAESIKQCDYIAPIIVDEDMVILAGHTRHKALKSLGKKQIEVMIIEGLTEDQKKKYRLLDNKTNELAEWDFDLLAKEMADLDFGGFDFGFGVEEDKESLEDIIEDDPPEPPEEPKSKLGDIYQLGNHRVMCGDSTSPEDVGKLMDGEKANLVITDPPYNVAIGDKNKDLNELNETKSIQENILGDKWDSDEEAGEKLWKPAFFNMLENADDKCPIYCFMPQGGTHMMMMMMMMKEAGWQVKHELIWVKNAAVFSMGRLDYDYRHEPILYGWKNGHNFYGDYSTSVIDDTTPIDALTKAELKDLVRALKREKEDSVLYCDKPTRSDLHPTMKPIKLIARLMINSSRAKDNVLDIFGGSGSTLIAAEQLGRRCYMMELDPHYVDVIVERWENLTGKKAVLLNG